MALHVVLVVLAVTVSWRLDRPNGLILIVPPQPPQPLELPPYGGTKPGKGPSGGMGRPVPQASVPDTSPPVPAPIGKPDTLLAASPTALGPHVVTPPELGDGRLWVVARPSLPSEVADALYSPRERRDTVVVRRLRSMVDSLNVIIDYEQRARQKPVWTTDVAGKVFGIDSQYIHVAGIKIPTAALALLPVTLDAAGLDASRSAHRDPAALQAVRPGAPGPQAGGAGRRTARQGGHHRRQGRYDDDRSLAGRARPHRPLEARERGISPHHKEQFVHGLRHRPPGQRDADRLEHVAGRDAALGR